MLPLLSVMCVVVVHSGIEHSLGHQLRNLMAPVPVSLHRAGIANGPEQKAFVSSPPVVHVFLLTVLEPCRNSHFPAGPSAGRLLTVKFSL